MPKIQPGAAMAVERLICNCGNEMKPDINPGGVFRTRTLHLCEECGDGEVADRIYPWRPGDMPYRPIA